MDGLQAGVVVLMESKHAVVQLPRIILNKMSVLVGLAQLVEPSAVSQRSEVRMTGSNPVGEPPEFFRRLTL